MSLADSYTSRFVRVIAVAFLLAFLIVPASAQDESTRKVGLPDDWSHQHLIFSNPGTADQAMQDGTYEQWLRIQSDPRYLMQQIKRYSPPQAVGEGESSGAAEGRATETDSSDHEILGPRLLPHKPKALHRDWSMSMGSGANVGAGQYPAKFSFSTTQAFCDNDTTPDFVVYPTSNAGTSADGGNGHHNFLSYTQGQAPPTIFGSRAFSTSLRQ